MALDAPPPDPHAEPRRLIRAGRYVDALAFYDAWNARERFAWTPRVQAGHLLRALGRVPEAVECFRHAIALRPGCGSAWWSLANLKTGRFAPVDLGALEDAVYDPHEPPESRAQSWFALGKFHEDEGNWPDSARAYLTGNALYAALLPWDPRAQSQWLEDCMAEFDSAWFARRDRWRGPGSVIFIVGMPRSGSTLLEQMLGCHPEIEATIEHPDLWETGERLTRNNPAVLSALTEADARALGERYLAAVAPHRRTGRPYFIDKLPDNFQHIPTIAAILPSARIIDMRRDPRASGFSQWKQCFGNRGYRWTYDQRALARYLRDYDRWMAHLAPLNPERLARVDYERLVADPEGELRTLCAWLGLAFDPAMLEFWKLERPMRTSSSEQVKRPLYTSALKQWTHYRPWLGALLQGLA